VAFRPSYGLNHVQFCFDHHPDEMESPSDGHAPNLARGHKRCLFEGAAKPAVTMCLVAVKPRLFHFWFVHLGIRSCSVQ